MNRYLKKQLICKYNCFIKYIFYFGSTMRRACDNSSEIPHVYLIWIHKLTAFTHSHMCVPETIRLMATCVFQFNVVFFARSATHMSQTHYRKNLYTLYGAKKDVVSAVSNGWVQHINIFLCIAISTQFMCNIYFLDNREWSFSPILYVSKCVTVNFELTNHLRGKHRFSVIIFIYGLDMKMIILRCALELY